MYDSVTQKPMWKQRGADTFNPFSSGAELLWSNPNPSATFSPQTISLDLSDYTHVIVYIYYQTGTNKPVTGGIYPIGFYGSMIDVDFKAFERLNCSVSASGVYFGNGYRSDNKTTNNVFSIPWYIYGVKLPT